MLINAVVYTFPAERTPEVEALFRELRRASLAEPGCVGFEVCRADAPDAGTFALYETWRDQAALDAHYLTEHFVRLGTNGIRPLALERRAVKGTPVT